MKKNKKQIKILIGLFCLLLLFQNCSCSHTDVHIINKTSYDFYVFMEDHSVVDEIMTSKTNSDITYTFDGRVGSGSQQFKIWKTDYNSYEETPKYWRVKEFKRVGVHDPEIFIPIEFSDTIGVYDGWGDKRWYTKD